MWNTPLKERKLFHKPGTYSDSCVSVPLASLALRQQYSVLHKRWILMWYDHMTRYVHSEEKALHFSALSLLDPIQCEYLCPTNGSNNGDFGPPLWLQSKISQQWLDGWPWDFVQTFVVPQWCIPLTFRLPSLFLYCSHQLKSLIFKVFKITSQPVSSWDGPVYTAETFAATVSTCLESLLQTGLKRESDSK